jgi:hypothetical protein
MPRLRLVLKPWLFKLFKQCNKLVDVAIAMNIDTGEVLGVSVGFTPVGIAFNPYNGFLYVRRILATVTPSPQWLPTQRNYRMDAMVQSEMLVRDRDVHNNQCLRKNCLAHFYGHNLIDKPINPSIALSFKLCLASIWHN